MTEFVGAHAVQAGDSWLGLAVLRAVPCGLHGVYTTGCPDCLTGEQAAAAGHVNGFDLGVVATSWEGEDG